MLKLSFLFILMRTTAVRVIIRITLLVLFVQLKVKLLAIPHIMLTLVMRWLLLKKNMYFSEISLCWMIISKQHRLIGNFMTKSRIILGLHVKSRNNAITFTDVLFSMTLVIMFVMFQIVINSGYTLNLKTWQTKSDYCCIFIITLTKTLFFSNVSFALES